MPFLRFTRDKRGYENTFVMQAARVRGRKHARVLYWFRTPPGVRVGRAALDEEAIRTIEATHPDIHFDWPTILQRRIVRDVAAIARHQTAPGPSRRDKRREDRVRAAPPGKVEVTRTAVESEKPIDSAQGRPFDAAQGGPAAIVDEPAIDSLIGDGDLESAAIAEHVDDARPVPMLERNPALEELVGPEGVARLRARFAELRTRIAEQADAAALLTEAEPLDPDCWVTTDEARRGLEQFEAGFEAIRRRLPFPRKRRKRGRRSNSPDRAVSAQKPADPLSAQPQSPEDSDPSNDV